MLQDIEEAPDAAQTLGPEIVIHGHEVQLSTTFRRAEEGWQVAA